MECVSAFINIEFQTESDPKKKKQISTWDPDFDESIFRLKYVR